MQSTSPDDRPIQRLSNITRGEYLNLKLKDNNETFNQVTQSSYYMLLVTSVLDIAS